VSTTAPAQKSDFYFHKHNVTTAMHRVARRAPGSARACRLRDATLRLSATFFSEAADAVSAPGHSLARRQCRGRTRGRRRSVRNVFRLVFIVVNIFINIFIIVVFVFIFFAVVSFVIGVAAVDDAVCTRARVVHVAF
jgi:hypothetical protein